MRNDKINNAKLGVFVIVAMALFITGIYYIGSRQNMFGSSFVLSAVFEDVNGLQPGNGVRYSGINVGSVKAIKILNETTIRVDMSIKKEVQSFIKQDAIAKIGTDGLVGNVIVEISAGNGNKTVVSNGDTLKTIPKIKTDDLLQTLSSTGEYINATSQNLMKITSEIAGGNGTISTLLNDEMVAKELVASINNMNRTTIELSRMVNKTGAYIDQINQGKSTLGYLFKDTSLRTQVSTISNDLDQLITVRTEPLLKSLLQSGENMEAATSKFNDLIKQMEGDKNVISLLSKDTKTAEELNEMIYNLNEGSMKFNEVMEALKHNFLVRGFFKDKKKEKEDEKEKE